jgi:hypothetical protein
MMFVALASLLTVSALLAGNSPARRATRSDPMAALTGIMKGYVRKKFLGKDSAQPGRPHSARLAWRRGREARIPRWGNERVCDRPGRCLAIQGIGEGEQADLELLFRLIDEIVIRWPL